MIAQVLLSAMLFAVFVYALYSVRRVPLLGLAFGLASLAGLFLVWRPDDATWIANRIGIGRGVDLILYLWVVVSLMAILNLHLKLKAHMEIITTLARKIALMEAERDGE